MILAKKKLQILQQQGIADVLVDVLVYIAEVSGDGQEVTDVEYRDAAMNIVKALSTKYRKEMKAIEVSSKQIDLEDAISAIHKEQLRDKLQGHGE